MGALLAESAAGMAAGIPCRRLRRHVLRSVPDRPRRRLLRLLFLHAVCSLRSLLGY